MSKRKALLRARQFLGVLAPPRPWPGVLQGPLLARCRKAAPGRTARGTHTFSTTSGPSTPSCGAYRRRWDKRFAARPLTADERKAAVQLASGRVRELGTKRLGVDGAAYSPGVCADLATVRSCVIVRNSASIAGVVTFEREAEADAWLRTAPGEGRATRRGRGWPGPRPSVRNRFSHG